MTTTPPKTDQTAVAALTDAERTELAAGITFHEALDMSDDRYRIVTIRVPLRPEQWRGNYPPAGEPISKGAAALDRLERFIIAGAQGMGILSSKGAKVLLERLRGQRG